MPQDQYSIRINFVNNPKKDELLLLTGDKESVIQAGVYTVDYYEKRGYNVLRKNRNPGGKHVLSIGGCENPDVESFKYPYLRVRIFPVGENEELVDVWFNTN